jgi:hypothetical protein
VINRVLHVVIPVAFFVGALHAQDQIDPSRPIPAQHPTTVPAGAAAVEPIPRLASPTGQLASGESATTGQTPYVSTVSPPVGMYTVS